MILLPSGDDPNHNTEELKIISFESQSEDESESQDTVEKENKSTSEDEISLDDEAVIFFSSGTTGPPKGVILTQKSLISHLSIAK